jgi:hypothetical protein
MLFLAEFTDAWLLAGAAAGYDAQGNFGNPLQSQIVHCGDAGRLKPPARGFMRARRRAR